jgi:Spy/CpxP family protein refolding chaperone
MHFKSLPMLAVTIAGTAMIAAACQAPSSQTQQPPVSSAQAQQTGIPDPLTPSDLKLTGEQKTKIKAIQENYRSKIENILTNEQKNQLKTAREQGKDPRTLMQSLNLTDNQKQQLKTLRQSQRQELDSVLTDEQKQQLQEMRHKRQRMHKPEGAPASPG